MTQSSQHTELLRRRKASDLEANWPELQTKSGQPLDIDEVGIVRTTVPSNRDVRFHSRMEHGNRLRTLQYEPLHLAYWETPYYKRAISHFLRDVDPSGLTAADIGCGDGRFTEHLIELGFTRVVAVDADVRPLQALAMHAEAEGFRDNLLLIQSSADSVPIRDESLDVVLTIGVLYYLNERFEEGLRSVVRTLKHGGTLLDSEPDLEGAAIKAMIFEDLPSFARVCREHTFNETHAGESYRFRLFSRDELQGHYSSAGLEVVDSHGLSLIPSILRIGMVKGFFEAAEVQALESEVRSALDQLDLRSGLHKHIIWKTRKGT